MIKVKDQNVTLTGEDAERLQVIADKLGISPQKAFNRALRKAIKRDKKKEKRDER